VSNRILASLSLALLLSCGGSSGPVISTFTATPATVSIGQPTTLAWTVTNALTLSIDEGVGTVSGLSVQATPGTTTTFTLTATSVSGATATSTVTVNVLHPASIGSFSASPAQVASGAPVTLTWSVANAASVSIDDGTGAKVQPTGATTATVAPTAPVTTYKLIVAGEAGTTAPNSQTAVVRVSAAPVVSFLACLGSNPPVCADKQTISQGNAVTLTWSGARSYVLDDQSGTPIALGPLTSYTARPSKTTFYTLTATNGAASTMKSLTVTVIGVPGTQLKYSDPVVPVGAVVQLRQSAASTTTVLVLELVTTQAVSAASAVALDLPLDSSKVALATAPGNAGPGFQVDPNNDALDPGLTGGGVIAAKAVIGTSGPLADTLALGIAQKPSGPGRVANIDKQLASGVVLARLTLTLAPGAGVGQVFDGSTSDGKVFNNRAARALLRAGNATAPGATSAFAIGTLVVQ